MRCCVVCKSKLVGRQKRFCSRACKNACTNNRHQSYACQQARGRRRKRRLIEIYGKECSRCGYRRNIAALEFHHGDAAAKSFQLDVRSLSNRSWKAITLEAQKCVLLCSNCHKEVHNPDSMLDELRAKK